MEEKTNPLTDWLTAAEARCERASKGPWTRHGDSLSSSHDDVLRADDDGKPYGMHHAELVGANLDADLDWIAAARSDLPRALGLLRKALEVVEAVRAYTTLRNYLTVEACRMDQDRLEKLVIEKLIRFDAAAKDEGGG